MYRQSTWCQNLDIDLAAAANQDEPSDDQSTPINIDEDRSIVKARDIKQNREPLKDEDTPEKEPTPIELFAEKVTIAGLPEAYNAKLKADRIMFRMALMAAACMMIYQGIAIFNQYQGENTIIYGQDSNDRAPFPTVTICLPAVFNEIPFPSISSLSKHDVDLMKNLGLTIEDVKKFTSNLFERQMKFTDFGTPLYVVTRKLADVALQSMSENGRESSFKKLLTPPCRNVLSNCAFEGRKFDCCKDALFLTSVWFSCFQIKVDQLAVNSTIARASTDPLQLEKIGLTIDVSENWTNGVFENGIALDGFHLFVDTLPGEFSDPVPVPSGMNALVVLARPKKELKITQCFSNSQIPKLKYFDTYDQHGIYCIYDALENLSFNGLGCLNPLLSFFPTNQSCSFGPFAVTMIGVGSMADALTNDERINAVIQQLVEERLEFVASLFSPQSPCKPLCSKWSHRVLSTSYGSIRYRDKAEEKRQLANRSWSRIRVIMPDSTFTIEREIKLAASYLAFCDIGGMMGVWAGFSIITFAQLLFYSCYIVLKKTRSRRVKPI